MNATATVFAAIVSNASALRAASALAADARQSETPAATLATSLAVALLDEAFALPGQARRTASLALVAACDMPHLASLLLAALPLLGQ